MSQARGMMICWLRRIALALLFPLVINLLPASSASAADNALDISWLVGTWTGRLEGAEGDPTRYLWLQKGQNDRLVGGFALSEDSYGRSGFGVTLDNGTLTIKSPAMPNAFTLRRDGDALVGTFSQGSSQRTFNVRFERIVGEPFDMAWLAGDWMGKLSRVPGDITSYIRITQAANGQLKAQFAPELYQLPYAPVDLSIEGNRISIIGGTKNTLTLRRQGDALVGSFFHMGNQASAPTRYERMAAQPLSAGAERIYSELIKDASAATAACSGGSERITQYVTEVTGRVMRDNRRGIDPATDPVAAAGKLGAKCAADGIALAAATASRAVSLVPGQFLPKSSATVRSFLEPHYKIFKPAGNGPFPTVMIFHGAARGAWSESYNRLSQRLVAGGLAVLFVDSYTGRGIDNQHVETGRFLTSERAGDLLIALDYLRKQPWVAVDRIGAYGVSHGGATVMDAFALAPPGAKPNALTDVPADGLKGLKAAVLMSPFCMRPVYGIAAVASVETAWRAATPILAVQGDQDTVSDLKVCREIYDRERKAGHEIETVFYPSARHNFDRELDPDGRRYPDYDAVLAEDAMKRTLAYFKARL